ncbi:MAG TPA: response regulator [Reyranella sp.]|nr:response regulator [Reyranella sp.]
MQAQLRGKTILVVEDEFLVGADLRSMLEQIGAGVLGPIDNATAAVAAAFDSKVDGALLDIKIGNTTVEPIAEVLVQRKLPFILVSGLPHEGVPQALRVAPYLAKPVRKASLTALASALFI